jgi:hypothetical protein
VRYGISGRQVHDGRIVAIMSAYRIRRILTLNVADFRRFSEIKAFAPADLLV